MDLNKIIDYMTLGQVSMTLVVIMLYSFNIEKGFILYFCISYIPAIYCIGFILYHLSELKPPMD